MNDCASEMNHLQSELQEVRGKYEEMCSAHHQAMDLKVSLIQNVLLVSSKLTKNQRNCIKDFCPSLKKKFSSKK